VTRRVAYFLNRRLYPSAIIFGVGLGIAMGRGRPAVSDVSMIL